MKHSTRVGFNFGLTSGIITTLGLMMGLYSSTHSKLAVFGGILTIAVADSLSDAFGIHIAEEGEADHNTKEVWSSTISTFLAKFFFTLIFGVPILIFHLQTAVIFNIILGLIILSVLCIFIAKREKANTLKVIFGHISIAILVILLTDYLGKLISKIGKI